MKFRTNGSMAQAIVEGLIIDSRHGSSIAWNHLVAHGVPTPTILRILISQARRRATDPIYAADGDGAIIWQWLPPQLPAALDCSAGTPLSSLTKAFIFPEIVHVIK